MKIIAKRSIGIVLSLVLCFSLVFGIGMPAQAATVNYVKDGSYIYNWGTREVEATFMSPNAEAFYSKNDISYAQLASLAGSNVESKIPSSALFIKLQSIMKNNHKYINAYKKNNELLQYTDCQNGGGKISSFYSGALIGPSWNGEWNKEHTWPNSKGDKAGSGEDDVMMIRPTSTSENSSRGNKAYGSTTNQTYFSPNNFSNGKYDLRGDVARIILYQYVRWNCTNTGSKYNPNGIFGTNGVIESADVMLAWIEEDPVDTWELGRNDSVESITGTRNVFVDYPELAFVLFGEQVPSDYTTPSGNAKNGTTPTPTPDNNTPNNNQNNTSNSNQNNTSNNNQSNTSNNNQNNTQGNTQTNNQSGSSTNTTGCKHTKAYIVSSEEPRCETEGYTEGRYCPDCKAYISGHKRLDAAGHTYMGDCDHDCDVCDATREIEAEHTFDNNNICTVCGLENVNQNIDSTTTGALENDTDNESKDSNEESKSNNHIWWIIGVAVIIAGGVVLLIIFREKIWPKEIE